MECIEEFSDTNNNQVPYSNNTIKDNYKVNQVKVNLRDEKPINLTPKENLFIETEISNQDTIKAVYLNYEDLIDFDKKENIESLTIFCVDQINNLNNFWINVFDAINTLRRILKYYPQYVENVVPIIISSILKHCKSIRSNLAKASLVFISELFKQLKINFQILLTVMPLLFQINGQKEKKFLSEEAEKALDSIISYNFNYETLCIVINGIREKNINTSTSAFKTLENFINLKFDLFFDNNIENLEDNSRIFNLIKLCTDIFELKKEPFCKRSHIILDWLLKCCSKEKIVSILDLNKNEKVYEIFLKMIKNSVS